MKGIPCEFQAESHSSPGIASNWSSTSHAGTLDLSVPSEFAGPGGAFSPEDLFNHALASCFIGTFKVYAENSKVSFESVTTRSRLVVDFDDSKKPVMKDFFMTVVIKKPSDPEKAALLARKAASSGFILNSVKTRCHIETRID